MKVTAVYFSPTGNTKKSVEAMAAALSEQYEVLDLTAYENRAVERELEIIGEAVNHLFRSTPEESRWRQRRD